LSTGRRPVESVAPRDIMIADSYSRDADAVVFDGDALDLLKSIPDGEAAMVLTSPPYNVGKPYETIVDLGSYVTSFTTVIDECVRVLKDGGSLCWQSGNFIETTGEVVPLDLYFLPVFREKGLMLRNRIVWHFRHGLHRTMSFSGRYETILWLTRGTDYTFNLDDVRVPQRYPGKKSYKGPNVGRYSSNPLGKNPSDIWDFGSDFWDIPNVKARHIEKTAHPCQFPLELAERCVLALTNRGELVVDPYLGSGTGVVAAVLHDRRGAGSDIDPDYTSIARARVDDLKSGQLRRRPFGQPVMRPEEAGEVARKPREWLEASDGRRQGQKA